VSHRPRTRSPGAEMNRGVGDLRTSRGDGARQASLEWTMRWLGSCVGARPYTGDFFTAA
jgi:hypothetical protein